MTHVKSTGEIGLFKIESESGIASGTRRIVATTGHKSLESVNEAEQKLEKISKLFKTDINNVENIVEKYMTDVKEMSKNVEKLQKQLLKYEMESMFDDVEVVNGVKVLALNFKDKAVDELKEIVDRAKEKLQSGVVILGTNNEGKAVFVVGVTKDVVNKVKAGDIVKVAAQVAGGNGGGRPDFAQAGGKNGEVVVEAVSKAKEFTITNL